MLNIFNFIGIYIKNILDLKRLMFYYCENVLRGIGQWIYVGYMSIYRYIYN